MTQTAGDVERLMARMSQGDRSAMNRLMSLFYDDLRTLASKLLSRECSSHTFQPTDLVNESFLKLADQVRISWQGKTHFMAVSAQAMRRILVDHARTKHRKKRGGRGRVRLKLRDDQAVSLECPEEVLFVDEILRKLAILDPLHARMLELRVFGGLSLKEIADVLGVSTRTIERHWAMVRAWFLRELDVPPPEEPAPSPSGSENEGSTTP